MEKEWMEKIGVYQHGEIAPKNIVFYPEIRKLCADNVCRVYGKTWACPPAVGTLDVCREKCCSFQNATVFSGKYSLEDPFDYEGMIAGQQAFKSLCDQVHAAAGQRYSHFLLLANGGCTKCKTCTYPTAPCRMPETLYPAVEGFGINVSEIASQAGIDYRGEKNTLFYFGLLLYDPA